jgi:hypothetical protein
MRSLCVDPIQRAASASCHELIPPARLNDEALSHAERRAPRFVEDDEVAEPSVITLNVRSAAQAVNDLMMMFTGLYEGSVRLGHQINFVRERELNEIEPKIDTECLDCGSLAKSRRGMGDRKRLPCRMTA